MFCRENLNTFRKFICEQKHKRFPEGVGPEAPAFEAPNKLPAIVHDLYLLQVFPKK